jgi:hypothetical protein
MINYKTLKEYVQEDINKISDSYMNTIAEDAITWLLKQFQELFKLYEKQYDLEEDMNSWDVLDAIGSMELPNGYNLALEKLHNYLEKKENG